MGRAKRPEWQYVQQVKAQRKGQWTSKCNFCGHVWDGGPFRIRAHLLSLPGCGVGPCDKVPEEVKVVVRRMHADVLSDGQDPNAFVDSLVDDLGGDASQPHAGASHASGSEHASGSGTGASKSTVASSSKKRKVAQGDLGKCIWRAST